MDHAKAAAQRPGTIVPLPSLGLGKKSLMWAAAESGGGAALTMAVMLLMARMMGPEDFSTAALVIGGVQFVNLFVEGLFHDGLIQNPDTDDEKFETALSLVLIIAMGLVAAAAIVALAIRHTPWAPAGWLVVGAALSLPFSGAVGIANARMRRDMIFREVARAALTARAAVSVLGLGLAYLGLGAWSLVIQYTGIIVLQALILYGQSAWRPRLRGSFGVLLPICRFAVPYALMHSLVGLRIQGFLWAVTALMGVTASGFVSVAFRLTTTPQNIMASAFTNLGLPLLARHQSSRPELERSFVLVTQIVMSTTVPAFVGLALTASDLVPVLLGTKWMPAIPLVQVLALGAALGFLRFSASALLRALGHVRYSFASSLFQLTFTMIGMFVLQVHDLRTAAWLWVLPAALQLPLALFVACRVSTLGWRMALGSLLPVLTATAAMAVVVVAVGEALLTEAPIYRLGAKIACGAATAVLILLLADGRSRTIIAAFFRKALA
jgi:PST family polysaccharide transporter